MECKKKKLNAPACELPKDYDFGFDYEKSTTIKSENEYAYKLGKFYRSIGKSGASRAEQDRLSIELMEWELKTAAII